jgi:hypothetical protein
MPQSVVVLESLRNKFPDRTSPKSRQMIQVSPSNHASLFTGEIASAMLIIRTRPHSSASTWESGKDKQSDNLRPWIQPGSLRLSPPDSLLMAGLTLTYRKAASPSFMLWMV